MAKYNTDELKKVQAINLEMARFFVEFCQEHQLLCYFCGGGCIGTVRGKGFIPWDDDLDFFMPRDDYERLKREWTDTDRYVLRFPAKDYNDHGMFTTLRDKNTTMIKPYQADMDIVHGITIDIFPLDGCPSGTIARKLQLMWALVYHIFCAQLVPTNHGKTVQTIGRIILGVFKSKTIRYYIWRIAEKKMSKHSIQQCRYITELCAGPKYMHLQYPKEWFEKAIMMDFEDTQMPVPVGYDGYLRMAFGEYMQLPPEEQQIPSHDAFIDADNSYQVYKGIQYCTGDKTV